MADQESKEAEQMKKLMEKMRKKEYEGLTEEEIKEKERQKECRKKKNIHALENTLDILEKGYYQKDGAQISLELPPDRMRAARVFLPEELKNLAAPADDMTDCTPTEQEKVPCVCSCENDDALSLAWKRYQSIGSAAEHSRSGKVLVLNLASPSRPGGAVRSGASAQEEDLCRRSSLLLSLESESAKEYYEYNKTLKTRMGSDAVIISPEVEVIKDKDGELLAGTFPISVMTCAAPMVRLGFEGMTPQQYEDMLYRRIIGMLRCAAFLGYRNLVLGAFGCGVFGNDAAVVSDVFYKAINEFTFSGVKGSELFDHIDFAVLCSPGKEYNFEQFSRNFNRES